MPENNEGSGGCIRIDGGSKLELPPCTVPPTGEPKLGPFDMSDGSKVWVFVGSRRTGLYLQRQFNGEPRFYRMDCVPPPQE